MGEHDTLAREAGRVPTEANPGDTELGTLILDRMGRIVSCGEPAERIFGDRQSHLIGRGIGDLISGLCLGGTSPSYSARYLDYLSGTDAWRTFDARDAGGCSFEIELNLAPIVTEGQRLFLLNIRCAARALEALSPVPA